VNARSAAREALEAWLEQAGVAHEPGTRAGEVVVELPGERKLRVTVSLLIGRRLSATAFVVRRPDENHQEFYRRLLRRNVRLPGVAFGVDDLGDVYLTGSLPLAGVNAETLDDLLGVILATVDGSFNELLSLGFAGSIRREWRWRLDRGESVANLAAFGHLRPPDPGSEADPEP
jgi:hypothetical protein